MLFEAGSNSRKAIEAFFVREQIAPKVVTETENVEIIKALVMVGMGIAIIPYQAVAREVRAGQLFCARIAGQQLVRETGWVHLRLARVPRAVQETDANARKGAFQAEAVAGTAAEGQARGRHRQQRTVRTRRMMSARSKDRALQDRAYLPVARVCCVGRVFRPGERAFISMRRCECRTPASDRPTAPTARSPGSAGSVVHGSQPMLV